jgi:small subunit ribosomal protein S7
LSRRSCVQKRKIIADVKFNNQLISKIINQVMWDGKKSLAQNIVYEALEICAEKSKRDQVECLELAIENIKPKLEVKARRVGGATYQVPVEVAIDRQQTLAIRWLVNSSRKRSEKTMIERLSCEVLDALNNSGNAVRKKEETHKMADANKAFAHYKW